MPHTLVREPDHNHEKGMTMGSSGAIDQIMVGDAVYSSDGENLGTVAAVYPGYIAIQKGFFFPTDYYIPRSAIGSTSGSDVFLTVAKGAALDQGWDMEPSDLESAATTTMTDTESLATAASARGTERPAMAGYEATDEDELRIPVMEEELTATVRPQEAGAVRIEKRVVEEDRVLDVPVTEEQVRVERRIVDRAATAADAGAFEEIVIEVPLTSEQVELRKQARVGEEIVVSKEAVQRTEQVHGTVRREEVTVDESTIDASQIVDRETGIDSRP
jgi:uncharacterized protein (TIGR02271 family)